jgi:hypothetical protein
VVPSDAVQARVYARFFLLAFTVRNLFSEPGQVITASERIMHGSCDYTALNVSMHMASSNLKNAEEVIDLQCL